MMMSMFIRPLWLAILIWTISTSATRAAEIYLSPAGNETPSKAQSPAALGGEFPTTAPPGSSLPLHTSSPLMEV